MWQEVEWLCLYFCPPHTHTIIIIILSYSDLYCVNEFEWFTSSSKPFQMAFLSFVAIDELSLGSMGSAL